MPQENRLLSFLLGQRSPVGPFLVLLSVSLLVCYPVLRDLRGWGGPESDFFLVFYGAIRESLFRYHQLPLWNPYTYGGSPLVANRWLGFLTPTTVFLWPQDVTVGLHLLTVVLMVVGLWGMWLLARHLGLGPFSRYLAAALWMLSSWYPLHIGQGQYDFAVSSSVMPLSVFFYLKALSSPRWGVLCGAVLAVMIHSGSLRPSFYAGFLLFFVACIAIMTQGRTVFMAHLKVLTLSALFLFLFSAPRLLPVLHLHRLLGPSQVNSADLSMTYPLSDAVSWFVNRHQEHGGYWHVVGAYIGLLPAGLIVLSPFVLGRRWWPWLLSGSLLLLISMANFHPWAPANLLYKVPWFTYLRFPSLFRIPAVLCLAILAGAVLSRLENLRWRQVRFWWGGHSLTIPGKVLTLALPAALLLWVALDTATLSRTLLSTAFPASPEVPQREEVFRQVISPFCRYPSLLRNVGAVQCNPGCIHNCGDIPWDTIAPAAVTTVDSPGYRGEVYFEGGLGAASYAFWSPNKLIVQVSLPPRAADRLIINQRYWPGWRTGDGRPVEPLKGLISTQVTSTDREVTFFFLPTDFLIGVALMALGLLLAGLLWWRVRPPQILD